MRDEEIDVFMIQPGPFQSPFRCTAHDLDGEFIDFLAIHLDESQVFGPRFIGR